MSLLEKVVFANHELIHLVLEQFWFHFSEVAVGAGIGRADAGPMVASTVAHENPDFSKHWQSLKLYSIRKTVLHEVS